MKNALAAQLLAVQCFEGWLAACRVMLCITLFSANLVISTWHVHEETYRVVRCGAIAGFFFRGGRGACALLGDFVPPL